MRDLGFHGHFCSSARVVVDHYRKEVGTLVLTSLLEELCTERTWQLKPSDPRTFGPLAMAFAVLAALLFFTADAYFSAHQPALEASFTLQSDRTPARGTHRCTHRRHFLIGLVKNRWAPLV